MNTTATIDQICDYFETDKEKEAYKLILSLNQEIQSQINRLISKNKLQNGIQTEFVDRMNGFKNALETKDSVLIVDDIRWELSPFLLKLAKLDEMQSEDVG